MANFSIKVLNRGDRYGLNDCLTHEGDKPLVEFYDGEQFVSRYYVETIMEHGARALSLQGDVPAWTVPAATMAEFINQLEGQK